MAQAEWQQAWRTKNPTKMKEYAEKAKPYMKSYYERNREAILKRTGAYAKLHRAKLTQDNKIARRVLRLEVIKAYGGKCECCAEANVGFLTIDHIFNDGHSDPNYRTSYGLHRWLQREGFPKDRYRLQCYNCNCGRHWNGGTCPHKLKY